MKKALLSLVFIGLAAFALAESVTTVDRIVAVVNKNVITEQQLNMRVDSVRQSLAAQDIAPPDGAILRQQVLDQMITEETLVQFARSHNITVSNSDVDQALDRLAQNNKTDVPGLRAELKRQGLSFEPFYEDIRRELLFARLKESQVAARVTVSDSEIEQVLKNSLYANNMEYHLANIMIELPERSDATQIEQLTKKAQQALDELNAGKAFGSVAASFSDGANAMKGGDLGWRLAIGLGSDFVSMLNGLKPGEHTGIIRMQRGLFIFQLIDKRSQQDKKLVEQYHVLHLLIRPSEVLSNAAAKREIEEIRQRIVRGESFTALAKQYSDDPSKMQGGDLGWISLDRTVDDFAKVVQSLPLNKVSEPVRTQAGWHLILVEDKRIQDVSAEHSRMQIEQQIRATKIEEGFIDWRQQVRDASYIQIKLEENP